MESVLTVKRKKARWWTGPFPSILALGISIVGVAENASPGTPVIVVGTPAMIPAILPSRITIIVGRIVIIAVGPEPAGLVIGISIPTGIVAICDFWVISPIRSAVDRHASSGHTVTLHEIIERRGMSGGEANASV